MNSIITVRKERNVRTDAELWNTSYCLLRSGQEHELGSTHQFRASLIFTAFALEAYLNYLGPKLFKSWKTIERKLTPGEKLTLLCEKLELDSDWSARPWQTIRKLIGYRNTLAHGRSEGLVEEYPDSADHYQKRFYERLSAKWEKYESEGSAIQARKDVEDVVHQLHQKSGDPLAYPFASGFSFMSTGDLQTPK